MKSSKKAARLVCLVLLVILASVGIGLSGGIVVPVSRRRENEPVTIELVEAARENGRVSSEEYKP